MATATEQADLEAICQALTENRPVDPEISRRVEDRANSVRTEIAKRGVTNVAIELIREARENE